MAAEDRGFLQDDMMSWMALSSGSLNPGGCEDKRAENEGHEDDGDADYPSDLDGVRTGFLVRLQQRTKTYRLAKLSHSY